MPDDTVWKVGHRGAPPEPKRKAPYAAKQRIRDGLSESQIEGIKIWNAWHDVLKENGLLEEKPQ